ncbi:MAG: substrate-binding domain-containing protein [Fibrobacteres bacterium]|nr:substrate-binding domain-containing protein [Fibrobacterota bacterium]
MNKTASLTDQCTEHIKQMLLSGELTNSKGFINEKELRTRLNVSRITMRRSLSALQNDNLLISIPYRGYIPGPAVHILSSENGYKSGSCRTILWVKPPSEIHKELMHEKLTLNAAKEEAKKQDLNLSVCQLTPKELIPYIEKNRHTIFGIALDWLDNSIAESVRLTGLPVTLVEGSYDNISIDSVIQANEKGTEAAINKLWEAGHKRIGMVVWAIPMIQPVRRRSAFVTALLQRGIIDMGLIGSSARFGTAGGREATARIFNRPNPPTAIIICHPEMASGVIDELESRKIRPGDDINLTVWGMPDTKERWIGSKSRMKIPMDFITWSREEMGRLVIRTLEARRSDPTMPPLHIEVPISLING